MQLRNSIIIRNIIGNFFIIFCYKEVAYIDATTGLPTKIEKYEEANGTMDLINTNVYEFKYVTSPENLFDTNGVNLKQLPDFNYDENAKVNS